MTKLRFGCGVARRSAAVLAISPPEDAGRAVANVAHSPCSKTSDHDHRTRSGHCPLVDPGDSANSHRHFSYSGLANYLCRATFRWHEPATDGRFYLVLLRVPLPVHQWH